MSFSVRRETDPDYVAIARAANDAFESDGFSPQRLKWLYERAFSLGADVLSLFADDQKIGQVVLLHQAVRVGSGDERAVALVDLFIRRAFRSRDAIAALYGEVERFCVRTGVRYILAVPNGKAAGVNQRFLSLQARLRLDIRIGLAAPTATAQVRSAAIGSLDRASALALFGRFVPSDAQGLSWTAERLWERLQDPSAQFGVHAHADLLLVSARRTLRRVKHTLLCAFFLRPGAIAKRRDVSAVVRAACRHHGRPLFSYAGHNTAVPLPGWSLPDRLRPSSMVLQVRNLSSPSDILPLDRFEALDFDFA